MNNAENLPLADLMLSKLTGSTLLLLKHAFPEALKVSASGLLRDGKYVGQIHLTNGCPLIYSAPDFDTPEAAQAYMQDVIEEAQKMTL